MISSAGFAPMEVGFALPQYDYSVPGDSRLRWESVLEWSDRAVAAGFTSLWVSDHLFLTLERYGGPAGQRYGCLDPITTMAALAARHPDVTIGCLVFCAQLRPPKILGKQLETLANLAPNRVVAGIGAGWNEAEFAEAGSAFRRPGERLREMVDAAAGVRHVLADTGRDVPIWFGGKGDRLVELAARHADGWNTVWQWPFDAYRRKLEVLRRTCERIGRDPGELTLSVGLNAVVGSDEADVRRRWQQRVDASPHRMFAAADFDEWRSGRLVGVVDDVRAQVDGWRTLGVRLLVVNLGALPFSVTDPDDLDIVASAVL
ncbi:MAG TPA: LLM class flavin-dependent oxidoreductase [Acidimicrobiales bacterium]|jgi:alkanesulfonate monooxygenase SsuD/methylene tetrahydromethanopterin reductase-like flavin-dependent oxidoreductase (luciferase family)|nr:LLM class flavin-dependent oxidoreductase [Acidimicrobiales bacterium]